MAVFCFFPKAWVKELICSCVKKRPSFGTLECAGGQTEKGAGLKSSTTWPLLKGGGGLSEKRLKDDGMTAAELLLVHRHKTWPWSLKTIHILLNWTKWRIHTVIPASPAPQKHNHWVMISCPLPPVKIFPPKKFLYSTGSSALRSLMT